MASAKPFEPQTYAVSPPATPAREVLGPDPPGRPCESPRRGARVYDDRRRRPDELVAVVEVVGDAHGHDDAQQFLGATARAIAASP